MIELIKDKRIQTELKILDIFKTDIYTNQIQIDYSFC